MASYATKVKNDIQRWREAGLVDAGLAARLVADIEERARQGLSFGSVLAILSALLFGASILIFIAANWDEFPRLFRVGLLFALILGGYVGGTVLKLRDHGAMGEAAYLIAAAAFGASIALIGQMYHLSGDERSAILTWCAGVAVAAGLLRSPVLTAAAVALAGVWMWLGSWDFWREKSFDFSYLAILACLWGLSLWTGSRAARHLVLLSLVGYAILHYMQNGSTLVASLVFAPSVALFLFATWMPRETEQYLRLGYGATLHGLFGFGVAMTMLQFSIGNDGGMIVIAFITFAGIVGALMLAGREDRVLRWLAYAQFGLELTLVYVMTVGSMLGTAGFLLAPGLLLAIMAFVVLRLERRLRAPQPTEGVAS